MKLYVIIFVLLLGPLAQAQTWQDIGGALGQACKLVGGSGQLQIPNLGTLPVGEIPNLEWLCTLNRMYRFVDQSIVGGDWGEFAREVGGQWIGDFANALGGELGIAGVDDWLNAANDTLRMTYRDFRRQMLYAVRDAYRNKNLQRQQSGMPVVTAGGLADLAENTSPALGLGREVSANAEIYNKVDQLNRAFVVQRNSEETRQNVASAVGSAVNLAQKIVGLEGVPGLGQAGQADDLTHRAQAALSTRQVAEIQTEALGAILKSDAVLGSTLISTVSEVAKQQMLTNQQLSELIGKTAQDLSEAADAQRTTLEQYSQENLDAVGSLAQTGRNLQNTVEMLYDPQRIRSFDWGN